MIFSKWIIGILLSINVFDAWFGSLSDMIIVLGLILDNVFAVCEPAPLEFLI